MITKQDVVLAISGGRARRRSSAASSSIRAASRCRSSRSPRAPIPRWRAPPTWCCSFRRSRRHAHGLAPTTSTLIQLALGDALAIAALSARLHRRRFLQVPRAARSARICSMCATSCTRATACRSPARHADARRCSDLQQGFGCLGITDPDGRLVGILTDGDLRRHPSGDILERPVDEVTHDPKTIAPDALVARRWSAQRRLDHGAARGGGQKAGRHRPHATCCAQASRSFPGETLLSPLWGRLGNGVAETPHPSPHLKHW